jgi:hypothetical protein
MVGTNEAVSTITDELENLKNRYDQFAFNIPNDLGLIPRSIIRIFELINESKLFL